MSDGFSPAWLAILSQKDRLRIAYYEHPEGITDAQAAELLKFEADTVKRYRNRLGTIIQKVGGERPTKYVLHEAARKALEREYHEWREVQDRLAMQAADEPELEDLPLLDLPAQIESWRAFFEQREDYRAQLYENVRAGRPWVVVEFSDLARHSPDLADLALEQPEEVLKAGEVAIEKMDVPSSNESIEERVKVRLCALPSTQAMRLREIRSAHIGQLYESLVDVDQVSAVRPQVTSARFECPACGNIIPVLQLDTKFKEPSSCGCGRKGKFRLLSKTLADSASVIVREPLAEVLGQATDRKTFRVIALGKHLTHKAIMDYVGFGKQLRIVYVPKEIPIVLKTGGQSTRFDLVLNCVDIRVMDEYTFTLEFTKEQEADFKEAAARPTFLDEFSQSVFHTHYGDEELKLAVSAQLVAGDFEQGRKDECLHVLIPGDPGAGKSQNIAARVKALAPICERVVGKGATVPGLTARSDKKDEFTGQYIPEPGVLPKAHKGIVIVDELDKMPLEAQPCLNEATSDGTVTKATAGSHLELPALVSLLALANPEHGRYDPAVPIHLQLKNIDETVRDRCIVFPVFDTPGQGDRDARIADKILRLDEHAQHYSDEFLRNYIVYARARVRPELRREEALAIKDFFVSLRASNQKEATIGTRQLPKLRALTLLFAKMRMRTQTSPEDFALAKRVVSCMLKAFGVSEANLHVKADRKRRPAQETIERATPEEDLRAAITATRGENVHADEADVTAWLVRERAYTETSAQLLIAKGKGQAWCCEAKAGRVMLL